MSFWNNVIIEDDKRVNSLYENQINIVKNLINDADAIIIGAGSGLSASCGLTYSGERFYKYFQDFIDRYEMKDMYSAGFYPFKTQEEKWAYWSRHIYYNRYDVSEGKTYIDLYNIIKDKNYFILTTNVDHQFQISGFESERIFATQGDYGNFQCAKACHKKLYNNELQVREMIEKQKNCIIPKNLVPRCPICGGNMEVNLRCDSYFVEDDLWNKSFKRYEEFLDENKKKKLLLIELGVGMNTPAIIKFPFWNMTYNYKNAFYVCVNKGEAYAPKEILTKSLCVNKDIAKVVKDLG